MTITPNICPRCGSQTGHNQIQMPARKTLTITEVCGSCGWAYRELKDGVSNRIPYADFEVTISETDVKLMLTKNHQ